MFINQCYSEYKLIIVIATKMIVKNVHPQPYILPARPKQENTPRVIINTKKFNRASEAFQENQEYISRRESINFDDRQCFNIHHKITFANKDENPKHSSRKFIKQIINMKQIDKTYQNSQSAANEEILSGDIDFFQFVKRISNRNQGQDINLLHQNLISQQNFRKNSTSQTKKRVYDCRNNIGRNKSFANTHTQIMRKNIEFEIKNMGKRQSTNQNKLANCKKQVQQIQDKCNKNSIEINPYTRKQYFHKRICKAYSSKTKQKKSYQSLDYSIIKPNQIKSFPLTVRGEDLNEERQNIAAKKKSQKNKYYELLVSIHQKQQYLKKHILDQLEQKRQLKDEKNSDMRSKIHTSYLNRMKMEVNKVEQKIEVRPWEVEGINFTDFL